MSFGGILDSIKDIFFPVNCLNCAKEGDFVCEECLKTLDLSGVFCCPVCHQENKTGDYCLGCQPLFIDAEIAVTKYDEQDLIGEIMHCFKYQYVEDLEKTIEKMIASFLSNNDLPEFDAITFVPLHGRRYIERGFNQSEKIAVILAKKMHKPVVNLLKRTRYTKPQAKFKRQERLVNLKDAFEFCYKKQDFKNKNVILVDDVFTTGSTMQECAKVLKLNKVAKVIGFSLARG
ncbi:MAG: ComF family protein [Patescibacteria group bacterium]|nr:ComF family protein [Patescibacteria group bacterium]